MDAFITPPQPLTLSEWSGRMSFVFETTFLGVMLVNFDINALSNKSNTDTGIRNNQCGRTESNFEKCTESEKRAIEQWCRSDAAKRCLKDVAEEVRRESEDFRKRTAISAEALQRPLATI